MSYYCRPLAGLNLANSMCFSHLKIGARQSPLSSTYKQGNGETTRASVRKKNISFFLYLNISCCHQTITSNTNWTFFPNRLYTILSRCPPPHLIQQVTALEQTIAQISWQTTSLPLFLLLSKSYLILSVVVVNNFQCIYWSFRNLIRKTKRTHIYDTTDSYNLPIYIKYSFSFSSSYY